MKLVMEYYSGSEYEGGYEIKPFEYESKEKAEYDFLKLAEKALEVYTVGDSFDFKFLNCSFMTYDFWTFSDEKYKEPNFYTLEEWFENERIDK